MTPLEVCERIIGPLPVIAAVCGLKEKAPYVWRRGSDRRLPGDLSAPIQRKLLTFARQHGLPLTAEHLILGAPAAEIDALLAARAERSAA